MTTTTTDLEIPKGLSALGRKAAEKILQVSAAESGYGCKAFYTPKEWADRGEQYGRDAELIVVYDGGDLRMWFSMDACFDIPLPNPYASYEKMQAGLGELGLFFEECTGWYAAVYKA